MTAAPKGKKANPRIDHGNGIRSRNCTMSAAAINRMIGRNIQRDTLGFGHWREPADWCKVPFTHTVTTVADVTGRVDGWRIYNSGVRVTLAVHPTEGPFVRGVLYVWCKQIREVMDDLHPTAPVFGRFLSQTKRGPKELVGDAQSKVLGAEYVYCFRAVGNAGFDSDLFQRSEIPVAIPTAAERLDAPAAFDVLQHAAKRLDQILENMADIADMTDELADAEKKTADTEAGRRSRLQREARAFRALQPVLNAAVRQSGQVETELADFLKESPTLARYLARWQAEG
jgi:hypothetical protein